MTKDDNRKFPWSQAIGGAGAGTICVLAISPLEVARTRLQVQNVGKNGIAYYKGPYHTISRIFREEGIRGWYRGAGVNVAALAPTWTVFFTTYSELKRVSINKGYQEGPLLHIGLAVSANVVTSLITTPFWVLKTRLQTQHAMEKMGLIANESRQIYHNSWHALRTIVRKEGIATLWSGLVPQLFGSFHVAVQFPIFEKLKATYRENLKKNQETRDLNATELIISSAGAKIVATSVAYPYEVLRVRTQATKKKKEVKHSLTSMIKQIIKNEGIRGFYGGLSTTLIRAVPSCAITFTAQELIQRNVIKYTGA